MHFLSSLMISVEFKSIIVLIHHCQPLSAFFVVTDVCLSLRILLFSLLVIIMQYIALLLDEKVNFLCCGQSPVLGALHLSRHYEDYCDGEAGGNYLILNSQDIILRKYHNRNVLPPSAC